MCTRQKKRVSSVPEKPSKDGSSSPVTLKRHPAATEAKEEAGTPGDDSKRQAAPRLEAAIVRCSSSTECCQEFPAADPDRSGWNPTLQVPDSASVFDLKIPPPDLRPEIRPSRSSSEDIEALNPIVLDTTEPYQTTIMLSHADTRLPRNVSFEKAQIPSYAEATAIENLPRTSPPAVSSQHTMFAHDSSPEATGSTTSGSSAVGRASPSCCLFLYGGVLQLVDGKPSGGKHVRLTQRDRTG
ncbi:hypothetical protein MRX96_030661 [Rhipicephalus microplus]